MTPRLCNEINSLAHLAQRSQRLSCTLSLYDVHLDMHLCYMDISRWRAPEINEALLQDTAPAVRAEVMRRLEHIWACVEPLMASTPPSEEDPLGRKADPRFIEAGIRVLDRLMRLYRLDHPGVAAAAEVDEAELAVNVEEMLRELEARLKE